MKLNIETSNAEETLKILQSVYINARVALTHNYGNTADYEVLPVTGETGRVYPLDGLIELTYYMPAHKIRIY